ncbi:MAG: type II toxin-antitoxin system VapC family toxin [Burkholderiales bacterium]|jgi:predicted nucleic acid-binding protein|nr:PIN domain-containing protein [Nitrosomonadaceae bacterium]
MIAVDSSVLIDISTNDPTYAQASYDALRDAIARDDVVVCDAVVAELCATVDQVEATLDAITALGIRYSAVAEQAAIRAGIMQRRYRDRGGKRERVISDFLVGSHALMQCGTLLTRDAGFFRDYFKGLKIINPAA